eukprot:9654-Heterococcus_DN1.PRE.3
MAGYMSAHKLKHFSAASTRMFYYTPTDDRNTCILRVEVRADKVMPRTTSHRAHGSCFYYYC